MEKRTQNAAQAILADLALKSVSDEEVKDGAESISLYPENLLSVTFEIEAEFRQSSTRTLAWAKLIALSRYIAALMTFSSEELALYFEGFSDPSQPHPLVKMRERDFLAASEHVSFDVDERMNVVDEDESCLAGAAKVKAWEDFVRVIMATTRVMFVLGSPDAGKNNIFD